MYKATFEKMLRFFIILFLIWNLQTLNCDDDIRNRKRYFVDIKDLPLTRQTYNISKSAYNSLRAHKQSSNALMNLNKQAAHKPYQQVNINGKHYSNVNPMDTQPDNSAGQQQMFTKLVSVTFPLNAQVVYQNDQQKQPKNYLKNYEYPDTLYKNMHQNPHVQKMKSMNVANRNMYTNQNANLYKTKSRKMKPYQNQNIQKLNKIQYSNNKMQDLNKLEKWIIQSTPLISFNKTAEKKPEIKPNYPKKYYTLGQHTEQMRTYYNLAENRHTLPPTSVNRKLPPVLPKQNIFQHEYCPQNTTQQNFNNLKTKQGYYYRASPRVNMFNYKKPIKQLYSSFPVDINKYITSNKTLPLATQEQSASRTELATFFNSFSMLDNISKSQSSEKEDSSTEEEDLQAESGCFGPCNDNVDDRVEELKNIMKILVPSNEEMFD